MRWVGRLVIVLPFQVISPSPAGVRPMMLRMVVVLPTPLRPISETTSPAPTEKLTPNSALDRP